MQISVRSINLYRGEEHKVKLTSITKIEDCSNIELWSGGVFYFEDEKIRFFYKSIDTHGIQEIVISQSGLQKNALCSGENLSQFLPIRWRIVTYNGADYLLFEFLEGERFVAYNLQDNTILRDVPNALLTVAYGNTVRGKYHFEEDPFIFDEYRIEHLGSWGYKCLKNGIEIWKFQGKGYLYTDFFRFEDYVCFGTAGMGGHFYILSLIDGHVVLDLKTGGTTRFPCSGDFCYVYFVGKNSCIAKINIRQGTVAETFTLPMTATIDSTLTIHDNKLYSVLFKDKRKSPSEVYMAVIEDI